MAPMARRRQPGHGVSGRVVAPAPRQASEKRRSFRAEPGRGAVCSWRLARPSPIQPPKERRMWIVRLALRRPYTIAVMALLILVLGTLSLTRMIVDIFPAIDIPVVAVVWNYPGLSAEEMERRVVIISERGFSTTVNGIERIESQSIPGIGLLKIYFQPGTDIGAAIAQIGALSSTILRLAPPGMQPPPLVQFNASNVPVAQLTASSATLPEDRIFDYIPGGASRSEEHTSELQSRSDLVCRLLLEKKKKIKKN